MYSISNYGKMITDTVRVDSYVKALRQKINDRSVVLDIGAGPGIFSLLACQLGARRVYAVEPDESIQLAKQIAAANGFSNRIEFIQDFSTNITLPEKADIVVSDISGVLPFFRRLIPTIRDARERLLVPGAAAIPSRNKLWAAVVEAPEFYSDYMSPWSEGAYDLDLTPGKNLVANSWRKFRARPEQLVTSPSVWADLDFTRIEEPDITSQLSWTVSREATGHAVVAWVEAFLTEDVTFSNAPGQPETIYGNAFLPWSEPVKLFPGDQVDVVLRADLVGDDYVWQWNTKVSGASNSTNVKAEFRQSTFFGVPVSLADLHKKAASHVPSLTEEGQIHNFILQRMNGEESLQEIAAELLRNFDGRFTSTTAALKMVAELSSLYSK